MALGKLGFGLMRLPVNSEDPTDINIELLSQMADRFLAEGFTYFDTSFVYHNGASEGAIRKALVERHERDSYTLATKFPTFIFPKEEEVDGIFEQQRSNCGVEYFDYYLLHNLNRVLYDGLIQEIHLFDHLKKWKEEGKAKHIGFSYHDSPEVLDRILSDHPEIEFVQIALNYYDWDEPFIAARACYEVIRMHGRQVVVMEPVKGGMLANVPATALEKMQSHSAELSPASYAIRFAAGLDGILAVLSGMSTMEQVEDNISYMKDFNPLTDEEREITAFAIEEYHKNWKYFCPDWSLLDDNSFGVPLSWFLRSYNSILLQPVPTFSAELNYYKSFRSAFDRTYETADYSDLTTKIGGVFDVTTAVKEAIEFQTKNSFQGYVSD